MASTRIFSVVFIIFSITVNVKSQTCDSTSQSGLCSSNNACRCLPITFSDNTGICGLLNVSCSRLSPCQPDDTCQNADFICIYHSQCSSTPLCYPLLMIDRRLCPPMPITITKPTTPSFTTQTATTPFFTTLTTTTSPSFFTTETTTAERETTDYDSNYFTTDSFPFSDSIMSNYSNVLTTNNEKFPNTNKYYQAIEILVNTSGNYTLNSVETIDGYGYLYQLYFDPLNPSYNLITQDDQSGGNNQFRINRYLQAGVSYILVFTTYQADVTGSYAIVAYGPDELEFNSIETFQTTNSTQIYVTSDYSNEFTSDYSDGVISNYSSELTFNSGMFSRPGGSGSNFYYEAIQINVMTTGTYTFRSQANTSETIRDTTDTYTLTSQSYMNQGNMDTIGYIYQANFYPSSPTVNLLSQDDDGAGNGQFRLTSSLRSDITYVLVFTTFSRGIIGPFSIVASGPDNVIFNPIANK